MIHSHSLLYSRYMLHAIIIAFSPRERQSNPQRKPKCGFTTTTDRPTARPPQNTSSSQPLATFPRVFHLQPPTIFRWKNEHSVCGCVGVWETLRERERLCVSTWNKNEGGFLLVSQNFSALSGGSSLWPFVVCMYMRRMFLFFCVADNREKCFPAN